MSSEQDTIRVQLNYPLDRVREPIIYEIITRFGVVPNIRRANFDVHTGGFIFLELSGESQALENTLKWLEERGISVSAIGLDGTQEWAV